MPGIEADVPGDTILGRGHSAKYISRNVFGLVYRFYYWRIGGGGIGRTDLLVQ